MEAQRMGVQQVEGPEVEQATTALMELMEIRAVLVGGSPLFQAGVAAALASNPRVKVVAQARDVEQALVDTRHMVFDVVVLHADVPHLEAAKVADRMAGGLDAGDAPMRLLVLTDNDSRDELLRTLRLGVNGYGRPRNLAPGTLCDGVVTVAGGGWWACPTTVHDLMVVAASPPSPPMEAERATTTRVSKRELEVLRLFADGATEPGIGEALHLSRNTVKTYLRRIGKKLGVKSRSDAVRVAFRRGLIPDRRRPASLSAPLPDPREAFDGAVAGREGPPLSKRELAVLRRFADGANEVAIAAELGISRNTVKTYLHRICEKLEAASRSDAMRIAFLRGLIPDRRRPMWDEPPPAALDAAE
jgi:two-component system response regulator DegU